MSSIKCMLGKAKRTQQINDGFALLNQSYSYYARLHESVYNCKIKIKTNFSDYRLGFYNVICKLQDLFFGLLWICFVVGRRYLGLS